MRVLPMVLSAPRQAPISVQRALKNALDVLQQALMPTEGGWEDQQQIAIDDLETMLSVPFAEDSTFKSPRKELFS